MNINDLTLGQLKEISCLVGGKAAAPDCACPYKIGSNYFIRTVTMSYTGRITAVHPQEIELADACWIADSGRFHKALKGEWDAAAEHEPFPTAIVIGRGAIIDACPLSCEIPKAVK
jgi:hypothetical protein